MAATKFAALLYRENKLLCLPDFLEDLILTRGLHWYHFCGSRPGLRGKSKIGEPAVLFSHLFSSSSSGKSCQSSCRSISQTCLMIEG
uniref:Uncharacterized protein n=1 Tax=Amphimedon queenslandica TaxID=400682 RepID=A0A1X7SIC5_AMPQE